MVICPLGANVLVGASPPSVRLLLHVLMVWLCTALSIVASKTAIPTKWRFGARAIVSLIG